MATENPKVSGYVPQAVYDQLIEFKNARAFNSVSLALTAALQEFFRLAPISTTHNSLATEDNKRLEEVEGKSPAWLRQ